MKLKAKKESTIPLSSKENNHNRIPTINGYTFVNLIFIRGGYSYVIRTPDGMIIPYITYSSMPIYQCDKEIISSYEFRLGLLKDYLTKINVASHQKIRKIRRGYTYQK
jgi:hypothetical protein